MEKKSETLIDLTSIRAIRNDFAGTRDPRIGDAGDAGCETDCCYEGEKGEFPEDEVEKESQRGRRGTTRAEILLCFRSFRLEWSSRRLGEGRLLMELDVRSSPPVKSTSHT